MANHLPESTLVCIYILGSNPQVWVPQLFYGSLRSLIYRPIPRSNVKEPTKNIWSSVVFVAISGNLQLMQSNKEVVVSISSIKSPPPSQYLYHSQKFMRHCARYRRIFTTNILLLIQGQKERAATTNINTKNANANANTMSPRRRSDPEWSWKSKSLIFLEPLVRNRFIASITSSFKSDKHHAVRDEAKRMLRLDHHNPPSLPPLWPLRR